MIVDTSFLEDSCVTHRLRTGEQVLGSIIKQDQIASAINAILANNIEAWNNMKNIIASERLSDNDTITFISTVGALA